MQARIGFSLLLFWLMTGVALAHGPTRQEVVEQITIDAPPGGQGGRALKAAPRSRPATDPGAART